MITKTSSRFTGIVVAGTITIAAVGANVGHKSAHPLAEYPLDTFVIEAGTTATSAEMANSITVQHAITGDVISAPAPTPGYYVGRVITDVRSRDST